MSRDYDALIAYLDARVAMPFAWGDAANDCVSHAAGAVEALTGVNPIRAAGHRWSSQRGALRLLTKVGGVEAAVAGLLVEIPPAKAQRGDIGLVEIDGRASLVVFQGDMVSGPGLAGTVRLPRAASAKAWRAE